MLSSDAVRNALDLAPDAMVFIDTAGRILFANRQVSAMFGHAASDLLGQPIECLLPERFHARHIGHRAGYFDSPRIRSMGVGLALYARRADGSEFPVEISLSPVEDSSGAAVAAAIRDVTERVRSEEQLKQLGEAADRANKAKSRFLATASHDLPQPLQALALLNGTLRRHISGDGKEALDQQDQAISAMSHLLEALLDISKLESGAVRPDVTDFAIGTLFQQLRSEFAELATSKGLELIVPPTPYRVCSDPTLVSQALRNLITNAIKYTRRGWVRLVSERDGNHIRITVADSGIGIACEEQSLIFDEFYQVGIAPNTVRDGYGLGLSIVNHVAQLLGLKLCVASIPGKGSSFTLDLPESSQSAAALSSADESSTTSDLGADRNPRPGAHVLVVEDDASVRNATRLFLLSEGFRVSAVESLELALRCFEESPPIDLLITDFHLRPGSTGMDVIDAARAHLGDKLRAILMTGDTSSAVRVLEADHRLRFVSKPAKSAELLELIHALLVQT